MNKEQLKQKIMEKQELLNMEQRLNENVAISAGELVELLWQASIVYAQKYHKAIVERKDAIKNYNRTAALDRAKQVWMIMGFSEYEAIEHLKVYEKTILSKGGTYDSVSDYFKEIMEEGIYYPKASKIETVETLQ